jgi:hypothetical protein
MMAQIREFRVPAGLHEVLKCLQMTRIELPYFVVKATHKDRMAKSARWEMPPVERHKTEQEAEKAATKLAEQTGEEYDVVPAGMIPPNFL